MEKTRNDTIIIQRVSKICDEKQSPLAQMILRLFAFEGIGWDIHPIAYTRSSTFYCNLFCFCFLLSLSPFFFFRYAQFSLFLSYKPRTTMVFVGLWSEIRDTISKHSCPRTALLLNYKIPKLHWRSTALMDDAELSSRLQSSR